MADYERMITAGLFAKIALLCKGDDHSSHRGPPPSLQYQDGLSSARPDAPALPALTCEPEPDIALVPLDAPTNAAGRPTSASLCVEVAESCLAYARDRKGPVEAAAGLQDYGLIHVPERCCAVSRQPVPDVTSFSGWRYQERQVLRQGGQVAPLVVPEVAVVVGDLLPTL
jgi:hypothetical protein